MLSSGVRRDKGFRPGSPAASSRVLPLARAGPLLLRARGIESPALGLSVCREITRVTRENLRAGLAADSEWRCRTHPRDRSAIERGMAVAAWPLVPREKYRASGLASARKTIFSS